MGQNDDKPAQKTVWMDAATLHLATVVLTVEMAHGRVFKGTVASLLFNHLANLHLAHTGLMDVGWRLDKYLQQSRGLPPMAPYIRICIALPLRIMDQLLPNF